ncbi:MAG: hypothetical protein AB7S50_08195 [Bacteroidales bacterium]
MGQKKGHTGNPNGRPKGSRNKTPEEIRLLIQSFIDNNLKTLQSDFEALEPSKRLDFIEKLLKHILPKPLNELERLTDEQLDELIERLKKGKNEN